MQEARCSSFHPRDFLIHSFKQETICRAAARGSDISIKKGLWALVSAAELFIPDVRFANPFVGGKKMKRVIFGFLLSGMGLDASAAGFHYCTGKITSLITRASPEESQVTLEGMNGGAQLGYGGGTYAEMQKRQFSMLLATYMAGKPVTLELDDSSLNCQSNHAGLLVRFVLLSN